MFTMPEWVCQACGHQHQEDEYWQLDEGDELECAKCKAAFEITDKECVMHFWIAPKQVPHAR